MADDNYRRLAAACHCGQPVKLWSGVGRKPVYCDSHKAPPRDGPAKIKKECPACRGFFFSGNAKQVFCSTACAARIKMRKRRGSKPKDEVRQYSCAHCNQVFCSAHPKPRYCSKKCKAAAWVMSDPARSTRKRQKKFSFYWSGYCQKCGTALGGKKERLTCHSCSLASGREKALALALQRTAQRASVTSCRICMAMFCPLYGNKAKDICSAACIDEASKRVKRATKSKREALIRGASSGQVVDPIKVFERDGWKCQACGINTPRDKRGTYDADAPELDHIWPVSKGGAHSYANTRCLCRSCNSKKSDSTDERWRGASFLRADPFSRPPGSPFPLKAPLLKGISSKWQA